MNHSHRSGLSAFLHGLGRLLLALPVLFAAAAQADSYVQDAAMLRSPQFHQTGWPSRVTSGPSGKVYVTFVNGGQLSGVANQRRGAVIRLNADGTPDPSFHVGAQFADAWPVIEQANGQVLVGALAADESWDSGLPLYRVFRLNADGSRDPAYQSPVFGNMPRYMAQQADGKLLVSNQDGGYNNGGAIGLRRLNSDGSLDLSFTPPIIDGAFFANIVVDDLGRILVAGTFTAVNGQPRPGIARLLGNGMLDGSYIPAGFISLAQIRGIALQTQGANAGKIVMAGGPLRTTTGSQNACPATGSGSCPLLRLNPNGSLDPTFLLVNKASTGAIAGRPRLLAALPNDQLLIVDSGVARFNADGSLDPGYGKPVFSLETFWMDALADGRVYVPIAAGSSVNGSAASQQIMRFNANGTADTSFAPGVFQAEHYPADLAVLADGGFLTWGDFDTVGATPRVGAALFNPDGTLDSSYALSGVPGLLGISAAGLPDDGRLLALVKTGTDPTFGYSAALARFGTNGAADLGYAPDSTLVAQTTGFRALPDGKALLWGQPTDQSVISATPVFLKRLATSGALDGAFLGLSGADGLFGAAYADPTLPSVTVGAFTILGRYVDGRLIAAATLAPYSKGATAFSYTLLRLNANGTLDSAFAAPTVAWSKVYQSTTSNAYPTPIGNQQFALSSPQGSPFSGVLIQADGSLVVYGAFTTLGGQAAAGIARLSSSGALDITFSAGSGAELRALPGRTAQVKDVALDAAGNYWVSGVFDTFAGQSAAGLARLNPNGSLDNSFSTPLTYRSYGGSGTRVVFDGANRELVLGSYLPGADDFPDAIHRLVVGAGTSLSVPLVLAQGWNLLGNSLDQPLPMEPTFSKPALVSTVWKWDTSTSGWQFYSPALSPAELQAYAISQNYAVLSTINPGQGYWVNAKTATDLGTRTSTAFNLGATNLVPGWNLVATGNDVTPSAFNRSLSATPPVPGVVPLNLNTLWAWDSTLSSWYFYAPMLDANGGLASYITDKGYLDFTAHNKTLGKGTGFWVSKP